jgi:DNA replication protein DnaC
MTDDHDTLQHRAERLGLYGLLDHWGEISDSALIAELLGWEESERHRRSLERRIRNARIGSFKPLADFDWDWPEHIDREQIRDLLNMEWPDEAMNVILVGPNGVGKSMLAKNLGYQALLNGHTVRFTTASEMLNDLAAQEGAYALNRRIRHYCRASILCVDELGYLSYDNRYADLLFEVVSRRYGVKSTLVTTNKTFSEWNEVFPSAACVVTLVDRLVHHAEVVQIKGESYRLKESKEGAARRAEQRRQRQQKERDEPQT